MTELTAPIPLPPLLLSANGILFGTTYNGGTRFFGSVFSLRQHSSRWTFDGLYNFTGAGKGQTPAGGVITDRAGNLYGTTYAYDTNNFGVAFLLRRHAGGVWKEHAMYRFEDNGGGEEPYAGLTLRHEGEFYGTTSVSAPDNGGVAFKLVHRGQQWVEKVIHAFGGSGDGKNPYGGLVEDKSGNLYGTTGAGGTANAGVVFELHPTHPGPWTEQILHSFTGGDDGEYPAGDLTLDASGNLYGATQGSDYGSGHGVIFEIVR